MLVKKSVAVLAVLLFAGSLLSVHSQSTAFTYQGSLKTSGSPANGNYDLQFLLFDAASAGTQLGPTVSANGVAVADGTFSVSLDFGNQFPGANRFLEIRVQPPGGGGFTTLAPRQMLMSTPYSIKTLNAENANQLGGIASGQYLQTNGSGSGLTDLNAGSVTSGTLSNARLGQIPTANIADSAVTAPKIAAGQVVKGVTVGATTLTDGVTLAAGTNITLTPTGNSVTIASTSGGVGGSGTTGTVPLWNGGTTLTNSQISQDVNGVQMPNIVAFAAGAQGNAAAFGSPNGETGLTLSGANGRADLRFDGSTIRLVTRPAGSGPPSASSGLTVSSSGAVSIGRSTPTFGYKLRVESTGPDAAIMGINTGSPGDIAYGVYGETNTPFGYGVFGRNVNGVAGYFDGRVAVTSLLSVDQLGAAGGTQICWNQSHVFAACSSSLRYKKDLLPFGSGLDLINKLRPMSFTWKDGGMRDVGFGAEDVAKVEPLFVTYNQKGEIEGVKYDRLSVLFVNAIKEQQSQIETQQKQIEHQQAEIDALKALVCNAIPTANGCKK